jgi:hypothetical protein
MAEEQAPVARALEEPRGRDEGSGAVAGVRSGGGTVAIDGARRRFEDGRHCVIVSSGSRGGRPSAGNGPDHRTIAIERGAQG